MADKLANFCLRPFLELRKASSELRRGFFDLLIKELSFRLKEFFIQQRLYSGDMPELTIIIGFLTIPNVYLKAILYLKAKLDNFIAK